MRENKMKQILDEGKLAVGMGYKSCGNDGS